MHGNVSTVQVYDQVLACVRHGQIRTHAHTYTEHTNSTYTQHLDHTRTLVVHTPIAVSVAVRPRKA